MKLHEQVAIIRKQKGITQVELSQKTGIRQAAISNFEKGKKSINSKNLELVFAELGISIITGGIQK